MARINEQTMLAFQDEFEKQAISLGGLVGAARSAGGYLSRQATSAGAGAALGGAGGAGLGALAGGVKEYHRARQEGATGREALRGAMGGALQGGMTGAALGAGVGGAAGLAGGARARGLVSQLRGGQGALSSVSRFGERQMHGLTGALPPGMSQQQAMKALDMGSVARARALKAAEGEASAFRALGAKGEKAPGVKRLAEKAYAKEESAQKALQAQKKLESLGATNVPGYLKALATKPGQTLKAGLSESWHGAGPGPMGWLSRGVTFGLPAVGVGQALAGPERDEDGAGRGQRVGQALGGLAFGVTGGVPMLGQMALTGLGTKGLEAAGKGVDRLRGKRGGKEISLTKDWKTGRTDFLPHVPEPEESDVSAQGLERVYGGGLS